MTEDEYENWDLTVPWDTPPGPRPTKLAPRTRHALPARASVADQDAGTLFLTVEEAASLLRTSCKAIYAMAERAQLPGVTRIGRRLLVRRSDLLSWLDEKRAASPGGRRR